MIYHVGVDRAVDCELAWSPDSIRWQRVAPGVPFIPRGSKGSYDSACIYAPSGPAIAQDGRLLIYYGGDFLPHQVWNRHCLSRGTMWQTPQGDKCCLTQQVLFRYSLEVVRRPRYAK
jgi:hypothetical protein